MHRSFAWGMIAITAILLAPLAGVLGVSASTVQADTAAPTAAADDEIIVITSALQLRVDDTDHAVDNLEFDVRVGLGDRVDRRRRR